MSPEIAIRLRLQKNKWEPDAAWTAENYLDMRGPSELSFLIQDNRSTVRVPSKGSDPAFVLSCAGTGTQPDGTTAPVTANLYIDSTTQQLVAYAWDQ